MTTPATPQSPESALPTFPVDDATLLAVEHALGAALTYDRPDDVDEDDHGPWLTGADYSLSTLLDFLAGTIGPDPDGEVVDLGEDVPPDAPLWEQIRGARVVVDSRAHYGERDLIRALIGEVRRLRTRPGVESDHG